MPKCTRNFCLANLIYYNENAKNSNNSLANDKTNIPETCEDKTDFCPYFFLIGFCDKDTEFMQVFKEILEVTNLNPLIRMGFRGLSPRIIQVLTATASTIV